MPHKGNYGQLVHGILGTQYPLICTYSCTFFLSNDKSDHKFQTSDSDF